MTNPRNLVFGVGINDSDYVTRITKVVDGHQKTIWRCPFYQAWSKMLERSYCQKYKILRPTYVKCEVVDEWYKFSNFRDWMFQQDWYGNQLDKDILITGNKIYGPDTCVFISARLNSFLAGIEISGSNPTPVSSFEKSRGMFKAQCRNPFTGKQEYLGYFQSLEESNNAWRRRKRELAEIYASSQRDSRVAAAIRDRFSCSMGSE